jgi:putative NADH-flavin reductase
MTSIALIGATGNIGSRILDEALSRGHHVTGTTRDAAKLPPRANLTPKVCNTTDVEALAALLRGHDVVVTSIRWNDADIHQVLEAIRRSGVQRALFVIGAGSLIRSDGRTHFEHMAEKGTQPPTSKPAALAYEAIRAADDLNWTAISPPATIQAGQRTGTFRLGLDHLLEDDQGVSLISREDFAIAILDEVEAPKHQKRRFTAAY